MQIDRKKIVFGSIVALLLAFIVGYYYWIKENAPAVEIPLEQPEVPAAENTTKEFDTRLEAVDAIEEPRKLHTPSLYEEKYLDSLGNEDTESDTARQRIVDSIYRQGRITYGQVNREDNHKTSEIVAKDINLGIASSQKQPNEDLNFHAMHQTFYNTGLKSDSHISVGNAFVVAVNGQQTVGARERLELRLLEDLKIGQQTVPKHTLLYGFVSFKSHRVFLDITRINQHPIALRAFDYLDAREGIYIKNSYRQEARQEVMEDVAGDVNVPGLPQIQGIKQVFRRSNRAVKVTIHDQYLLYLRP